MPPGATIQDAGRPGWLGHGIPPSGPLDGESHEAANLAVGNAPGAAAIEIPLGPASFLAEAPVAFSVDGGPPQHAAAGATIDVPRADHAVRYLAVAGAFAIPETLGAIATLSSAHLGGLRGGPLRPGDDIPLAAGDDISRSLRPASSGDRHNAALDAAGRSSPPRPAIPTGAPGDSLGPAQPPPIRALASPAPSGLHTLAARLGPRAGDLPESARAAFFAETWTISRAADRVGVRLEGVALPVPTTAANPVPMVRGAIQITTGGTPIVLGPDHPTTGGYPVIAVLTRQAQSTLARLRPGARIRFQQAD